VRSLPARLQAWAPSQSILHTLAAAVDPKHMFRVWATAHVTHRDTPPPRPLFALAEADANVMPPPCSDGSIGSFKPEKQARRNTDGTYARSLQYTPRPGLVWPRGVPGGRPAGAGRRTRVAAGRLAGRRFKAALMALSSSPILSGPRRRYIRAPLQCPGAPRASKQNN
jgi:hypothetical protein